MHGRALPHFWSVDATPHASNGYAQPHHPTAPPLPPHLHPDDRPRKSHPRTVHAAASREIPGGGATAWFRVVADVGRAERSGIRSRTGARLSPRNALEQVRAVLGL